MVFIYLINFYFLCVFYLCVSWLGLISDFVVWFLFFDLLIRIVRVYLWGLYLDI